MSIRSLVSRIFNNLTFSLALVIILGILSITSGVVAEKIPSGLTIGIVPENPTIEQSFHVTGKLTAVSGEALGNKRVTLESSQKGAEYPDSFSFLAIKETTRDGIYEFFRPKNTPPEFLRVRFAGNDQYEAGVSHVLPVRGAGTDSPQKQIGDGTITVSTNPAGADIYIDGVYRGITPGMINGLSEGAHVLEVGKAGYQNQTMEAYVTPVRGSSFSLTLTPGGLGFEQRNFSSSLSYTENISEHPGQPDFSVDFNGVSTDLYGSSPNLSVTVVEDEDAVSGSHDVMVIMKDH